MVKSCRKNTSKRVTCHQRYKILRKVREHHRKIRKDQKKNPKKFKRKDPGVPNSLPFKEQLMEHIQETKKFEAERRLALLQAAQKPEAIKQKPKEKPNDHSFTKQFAQVLNKSDVVIEVLDARDPLGSRCLNAENEILAAGKKLILLLNKIDLVPADVVQQWLAYFRQWYTVMPFKANLQQKSSKLINVKGKIPKQSDLSMKCGLGTDGLMALLGNMCRHNAGKLTVGFVGIPNTGKSAVINTLIRRKAAPSSCVPGFTRECQIFKIDNKISLLDSPGIVLSKSEDPCELALRNCTKPECITEPEPIVSAILQRCPKRQIMVLYSISDYASTIDFLCQLAQRNGRLRKGGAPDMKSAARIILSDWITGKLNHYTLPPANMAPIAEPSLPATIQIDSSDLPLQELDAAVFACLPKSKMDVDEDGSGSFCPDAVIAPSVPFKAEFGESVENFKANVDNDDLESVESDAEKEADARDDMDSD